MLKRIKRIIKNVLNKGKKALKIREAKDISEIDLLTSSLADVDAIILGNTVGNFNTSFIYFSSKEKAKETASVLNLEAHRALTPELYYINVYKTPSEFLENVQNSGYFDVTIKGG